MGCGLLLSLLALAGSTAAHFVLLEPVSLGYDDTKEIEGPCGSFLATDRSQGVTDWPVNGHFVHLLSTHEDVEWDISAALISEGATEFLPLVLPFNQLGVGDVCFESVPGQPAWIGQDAVVQLVQHAPDGLLYQCAAVRFVAGGPAPVPGDCVNTGGVSIGPIIPAPPLSSSTTSTSSEPTSTGTTASSEPTDTTMTSTDSSSESTPTGTMMTSADSSSEPTEPTPTSTSTTCLDSTASYGPIDYPTDLPYEGSHPTYPESDIPQSHNHASLTYPAVSCSTGCGDTYSMETPTAAPTKPPSAPTTVVTAGASHIRSYLPLLSAGIVVVILMGLL